MFASKNLQIQDNQVFEILKGEEERQKNGMELIASENYVSEAVLSLNGSIFTNKYSEGYPGKRYYGGQEWTDKIENLAIERVKKIFNCQYANVQPHSGAPANNIVYNALLKKGDVVLGMRLDYGGHLTHGHPVTESAKNYRFIGYKADPKNGLIDYENLREMALEHKPKLILAGFSAYSRNLDYAKFKEIADEVGALTMMDMAHIAGLIAGGVLENPFDHNFDVVTSTTHKTLRGPRGGLILTNNEEIIKKINKQTFPGEQGGPHMHTIGAKAVAFGEALKPEFKKYAKQILLNAKSMEKVFQENKIEMVFGGSDNHLFLIDTIKSFGISGSVAEKTLDKIQITLNKNAIPEDPRGPFDPSGIRLGTPAMTTRGMKEKDFQELAKIIVQALQNHEDDLLLQELSKKVSDMCQKFPVPGLKN